MMLEPHVRYLGIHVGWAIMVRQPVPITRDAPNAPVRPPAPNTPPKTVVHGNAVADITNQAPAHVVDAQIHQHLDG